MPFFTGLVGGISEGLAGARKEAADRNERQSQLEAQILQHLSTSTDPEISSRALAGLLGQADPATRKKAKGLRGFLGETEGNPALPMLRDFISAGRPGPEIPAAGAAGVPSLSVQEGLPAYAGAPAAQAKPGSAALPATPGVHPGLSGPPPGPQSLAVRPGATQPGPIVPRQVFRTPDEQAELTAGATARGHVNAQLDALKGMTEAQGTRIFGHPDPRTPAPHNNPGKEQGPDGQWYQSQQVYNSATDTWEEHRRLTSPPTALIGTGRADVLLDENGEPVKVWKPRDPSQPGYIMGQVPVANPVMTRTNLDQTQDPVSVARTFQPQRVPIAGQAGAPPAPGAAPAQAGPAPTALSGPPPSPATLAKPVGRGATPAAAGKAPAAAGGLLGRKRDLQSVEGAFMGPDGPVQGTAFLDKGLGQYFSSTDPTQPAQGFIPGDLGTYATQAFHTANSTLITIERAIQAIDDAGLAKNDDTAATAALMAKFYGGKLGDNPIMEAAASMTNLATLQAASQYVKSNSRSYQMFSDAKMHVPRAPGEQAAQWSQTPIIGRVVTPENVGRTGNHGWDSPMQMRQKLVLAQSIIQQGKAELSNLIGKAPERAVGAGGPPGPQGAGSVGQATNVPRGTSAAPSAGTVKMRAPDGTIADVPAAQVDKAKAAGATVIQ